MGNKSVISNFGFDGVEPQLVEVERLLMKFTDDASPKIKNSAQRIIKAGGKRLRPRLVIASAKCIDDNIRESTLYAAVAVELVHLATLVHDDIIDNSDVRWGMSTVNAIEGENHAIVLGDYLLSLASLVACEAGIEITKIINQACVDVCDGQSTETAELFNTGRTIENYLQSTKLKTASLLSASCKVGAISAGATEEQAKSFAEFGEYFGMSYQMIDDLMDLFSTSDVMKKPVGNDVKEGNYTYAVLLAFAKDENLKKYISKLTQTEIADSLKQKRADKETKIKIKYYESLANKSLELVEVKNGTDELRQIVNKYANWAVNNLG